MSVPYNNTDHIRIERLLQLIKRSGTGELKIWIADTGCVHIEASASGLKADELKTAMAVPSTREELHKYCWTE